MNRKGIVKLECCVLLLTPQGLNYSRCPLSFLKEVNNIMGREQDTNSELNTDRNFEHHKHNKPAGQKRDGDGRTQPKHTGKAGRDNLRDNDGGALGRNNGADKSGR
jgi:hypothetical protein